MQLAVIIVIDIFVAVLGIMSLFYSHTGESKLSNGMLVLAMLVETMEFYLLQDMPWYLWAISYAIVAIFAISLILGISRKPKKYASYLDVPRQVIYMEDLDGVCHVLTEKQASIAIKNNRNVYIHAVVRVKYTGKH